MPIIERPEGWYAVGEDGWDEDFVPRAPAEPREPDRCRHCGTVLSANPKVRHDHIANCAVWA